MTVDDLLDDGAPPLVAILRGVRPDEIVGVSKALVEAGIRMIEVPLNSPDPINSIRQLVDAVGAEALCGAGTVLDPVQVDAIATAGGKLIVTPNVKKAVIARCVELGLEVMPGFVTPSEAFSACAAGARRLKLFPAASFGTNHLKAIREVLPTGVGIWAVGGTSTANLGAWLTAGAEGLGVGSSLYRAGDDADIVGTRARAFIEAWKLQSGLALTA